MKDIVDIINMYLFEPMDYVKPESIYEELRIYTEDNIEVPAATLKYEFTKRAINKIAHDYDAKIEVFDKDLKSARLKDSLGRLIFVDGSKIKTRRR